jgi:hypothetical protein
VKQEQIVAFRRARLRRMAITFVVVMLVGVLVVPIAATTLVNMRSSTVARSITVNPAPGGVLSAGSQITFGGIPAQHLRVTATGSSSGFHAGILHPDLSGLRATFTPDRPFTPGETLDVEARFTGPGVPERNFNLTVARAHRASS